jgi:putative lipase involved disintegration of autophagic bodies
MSTIYKLTEFQSPTGRWSVVCTDVLKEKGNHWHYPAKALGISVESFINELQNKYKARIDLYSKEKCFVSYSWEKQSDMRKFKNAVNAGARKRNFTI